MPTSNPTPGKFHVRIGVKSQFGRTETEGQLCEMQANAIRYLAVRSQEDFISAMQRAGSGEPGPLLELLWPASTRPKV